MSCRARRSPAVPAGRRGNGATPVPGPTMMMRYVAILGQAEFRSGRKHWRGRIRTAIGQESGTDALPRPAVAAVFHDVDDEVNRAGVHLQARRDGVEPRLQFREKRDEFLRRKSYRRVFDKKIDHFQTPEVGLEVVFPFGLEQLLQERGGGGAFGDRLQEFRGHLRDAEIAHQSFAQRRRRRLGCSRSPRRPLRRGL